MLQEKALSIARTLDPETKFIASKGWLTRFLNRHDIILRAISGEGAEANAAQIEQWMINLPQMCSSYKPENIYNIDETGLFFMQVPRRSYVESKDSCIGGKSAKKRLTVCLFTNMLGEKENPIIIGHSKRPRCFGRIDVNKTFNIDWRSNKTAWMTAEIFQDVLKIFNRKMKLQSRKVILFLDNARCHPDILLSNVTLSFLSPNTTSHCQPLDQGIIQSFKLHYRKLLMANVVTKLDAYLQSKILNADEDLLPKPNVLEALGWIDEAWKNVKVETIKKCFAKSGFPIAVDDEEISEEFGLSGLISPVDAANFVNCDNDIGMLVKRCTYTAIFFHTLHCIMYIFLPETSNEQQNFQQWEDDYIEYIRSGGDVFEFEAGEAVEQVVELNTNNNLTRQQLVQFVQDLTILAAYSSQHGNEELFIHTNRTIRDLEKVLTSGTNTVQRSITNYFQPAQSD